MNDFTTAIYCFIDDYLQVAGEKAAAKLGCRGYHHRLSGVVASLFPALGQSLKELNCPSEYMIDSFPAAVCRNIRINRCKLLQNEAYRGYNASKRCFYGFKVEAITTPDGLPVYYFIMAGSGHDAKGSEAMHVDLPQGSTLYADSAYTNYELEDLYLECEQLALLPQHRSNSRRKDTPAMAFIKQTMRKRVETAFSGIGNAFPKAIHAVTPQGFLLKIVLFLFAYTIDKCL